MTIHLKKLAVGIESFDHLQQVQAARRQHAGDHAPYCITTRNSPKQRDALLDGGSLYWIIKGYICARQQVCDVQDHVDDAGKKYCLIQLAPDLVATAMHPHRPFQGWRYLAAADAPCDCPPGAAMNLADMPADMQQALREMGVL
jgi:hypothetical protein